MNENVCKNCNAPLDLSLADSGVITCLFCGSVYTLPKDGQSDAVVRLISAGQTALDLCRFDDALTAFTKAIELDGSEPEAYWGRAQARSRVQYLKDTVNNRLQPICHGATEGRFTDDSDYKKALELATEEQRAEYKRKAEEIDYIRSEFFKLEKSGLRYDCFICVKVTDDSRPTSDSKDAANIYAGLKAAGFKPFYSEYDMRGCAGADYEAKILYALKKSPCMIIVCSDAKYLETKWVKNEYTRYAAMIADEEKERSSIAIAFRGSPIEKLPGVKGKRQGIDLSAVDAIDEIRAFVGAHTRAGGRIKKKLSDIAGSVQDAALPDKAPSAVGKLRAWTGEKVGRVKAAADKLRAASIIAQGVLMLAFTALMITVQFAVTGWVKRPLWLGLWIAACVAVFLLFVRMLLRRRRGWDSAPWIIVAAVTAALAFYPWFALFIAPIWLNVIMLLLVGLGVVLTLMALVISLINTEYCKITACFIAIIFAHFAIVGLVKQAPFYGYDGYENGLFYNVRADGTAETVVYDTKATLELPYTVRGAEVVSFRINGADETDFFDYGTERLVIDERFTALPEINFEFNNLMRLREIVADGLKEVSGLRQCNYLRSVSFAGAEEIDAYAFIQCGNLVSADFSDGLKAIGAGAFSYCGALKELRLPAGVETIGKDAFEGCDGLTLYFDCEQPEVWPAGWDVSVKEIGIVWKAA